MISNYLALGKYIWQADSGGSGKTKLGWRKIHQSTYICVRVFFIINLVIFSSVSVSAMVLLIFI